MHVFSVLSANVQTKSEQDSLAEWCKALAAGASAQGRDFKPHSCQLSAAKLCGRVPDHQAKSALLPNVAHVVLLTSTQHSVKFKFPSTKSESKNAFRVSDSCVLHIIFLFHCYDNYMLCLTKNMTVWPSGLRRWLKAPVRKGVGSNPTAVCAVTAQFAEPA